MAGIAKLSVVAGLALLLAAPPAGGATVSVESGTLVIRDRAAESNVLSVQPGLLGYAVFDENATLTPGRACARVAAGHVVCGGTMMRVVVEAGRGTDFVDLRSVTAPVAAEGGSGDDLLEGGKAGDALAGGPGLDSLVAGDGHDHLSGGSGRDLLQGGGGDDVLLGGEDRDVLEGGSAADVLHGGQNSDWIRGGPGDDALVGGGGDDALVGGGGDDDIVTGAGTDTVFAADGRRDDIDCGTGDLVRRDRADAEVACTTIAARARAPRSWPLTARERAAATSAGVDTRATVRGKVLSRRAPQRILLFVRHRRVFPGRVRGRVLGPRGQTLRRFTTVVQTGNWRAVRLRPPRGAWTVRARCCG